MVDQQAQAWSFSASLCMAFNRTIRVGVQGEAWWAECRPDGPYDLFLVYALPADFHDE